MVYQIPTNYAIYVAAQNVAGMVVMSPFVFLPLFMILNAWLVVVVADILTKKKEDQASADSFEAAEADVPFRKAA